MDSWMINDNDPWLILCRLSTPELINLSSPPQARAHKLLTIQKSIPLFLWFPVNISVFWLLLSSKVSLLAPPNSKGELKICWSYKKLIL